MNKMLRNALRKSVGLRHQLEKNLLGDKGDIWEDELKRFLRQEPCWRPKERAVVIPQGMFQTSDTDLLTQLVKTETFWKKRGNLNWKKRFVLPEVIPWQNVLVIYDPGISNRQAVNVLKTVIPDVYEEVDVMGYSGSEAGSPSLHIIENSVRPTKGTMGLSPDQLKATGKFYLSLRGYVLAMSLYHETTEGYLDPETFNWFPENRLLDGRVAHGRWDSGRRVVRFHWNHPYDHYPSGGAREVVSVSLAT